MGAQTTCVTTMLPVLTCGSAIAATVVMDTRVNSVNEKLTNVVLLPATMVGAVLISSMILGRIYLVYDDFRWFNNKKSNEWMRRGLCLVPVWK